MARLGEEAIHPASAMEEIMISEFQIASTRLPFGLSVIEASAGTGKTYAISHLVPQLILEGDAPDLGSILLVTFTNDAASELSDRVRRVLEKLVLPPASDEPEHDPALHVLRQRFAPGVITAKIGQALLDLDRLGVSTIHSFCQRTIQSDGTAFGIPVIPELIPAADEILDQSVRDIWLSEIAGDPLLSSIAVLHKWDLKDDIVIAKLGLSARTPRFQPVPEELESLKREFSELVNSFTESDIDDLKALLSPGYEQNTKAPADDYLEALFEDLRTEHSGLKFLSALGEFEGAGGWVNGRKAKQLKANVEASPIVECARQIKEFAGRLRWSFQCASVPVVADLVDERLAAGRMITYDGLIHAMDDALQGPSGPSLAQRLRGRYRVALIDESQDTDARQFAIFRAIFVGFKNEPPLKSHRLVLIGDPKQAIYAFRGADVNTYFAACELAGDNRFSLTRTFRAPTPLVDAVNAIFQRPRAFLRDGMEFPTGSSGLEFDCVLNSNSPSDAARIEWFVVSDEDGLELTRQSDISAKIAAITATEIVRILNAGATIEKITAGQPAESAPVLPGDMVVLVNDRHQAAAMEDALKYRAVPAIRAGSDDVMASDEAMELLMVLSAVAEPRRTRLRTTAMATRMLGFNAISVSEELADSNKSDIWLERFVCWQVTWQRYGVAALLEHLDRDCGVSKKLAGGISGERRLTNLRQLTDLLQRASHDFSNRAAHLLRWFAGEVHGSNGRSGIDERLQQLESDANAVHIVTMHSAKGLEYPLVFCPFLSSFKKPEGVRLRAGADGVSELLNLKTCENFATVIQEAMEDRLRLAYVAITRARVKVWIFGGEIAPQGGVSALDWLLRLPSELDDAFDIWSGAQTKNGRGSRHSATLSEIRESCASPNVMSFGPPPDVSNIPWQTGRSHSPRVLSAEPKPVIEAPWITTSFSALTREKHPHAGIDAPVVHAASGVPAPNEVENPFIHAPGGAMIGTVIHDWIEGWDLRSIDPGVFRDHLKNYSLPEHSVPGVTPFGDAALAMLQSLPESVLPGMNVSLADACPDPTTSEWAFQLPIHGRLDASVLADVFQNHGHESYASMLRELPFESLRGYLQGFMDRIVSCNGWFGVIDWKTNRLGPSSIDYRAEALLDCAMRSHYLLQMHLYLVALRRFLGPGAKLSGAWLVFLRGVQPGSGDGILHVNPGEELMQDLDAVFSGPRGSARLTGGLQ